MTPGDAMLAEVRRVGYDETQPPALQASMIEAADEWICNWVELLRESPPSAVGPLASLIAAAYWAGQQAGRKEAPEA